MEMHNFPINFNFIFKKWIVVFFLFCAFTCISSEERRTPGKWWVFKGKDYNGDAPAYDYYGDAPAYDYGPLDDYEDFIMFNTCQDTAVGCSGHVNNCWKQDIKHLCKRTCGLCPGQTPVRSVECYDAADFRSCNDILTKDLCRKFGEQYCKKTCGLCEGMTQHPSMKCYDVYANCRDPGLFNLCMDPKIQVNCKKTCGLCGGREPVFSSHCWDEYKNCYEHVDKDCYGIGHKCRKSCGLCKGMTPHPSMKCYDTSHICKANNKMYCDLPIMKKNCKKLCNLC